MKIFRLCLLLIIVYETISSHNLVEVYKMNPNIVLDIKYATNDNFTGVPVYNQAKCFLENDAALALNEAVKEFETMGYKVKIWDGYRPQKIQYKFWDLVKGKITNPQYYVAEPSKGSRHNRGCAVDLTLLDKDGKELNMGTKFDDFSEKAHRIYKKLSKKILSNRKLLESVMEKHGFEGLLTEWWHFDYVGKDVNKKAWEQKPLLDIDFEDLEKQPCF